MAEVRVKEHIRQRLPPVKGRGRDVMKAAKGIQINAVSLQNSCQQKNNHVR